MILRLPLKELKKQAYKERDCLDFGRETLEDVSEKFPSLNDDMGQPVVNRI